MPARQALAAHRGLAIHLHVDQDGQQRPSPPESPLPAFAPVVGDRLPDQRRRDRRQLAAVPRNQGVVAQNVDDAGDPCRMADNEIQRPAGEYFVLLRGDL